MPWVYKPFGAMPGMKGKPIGIAYDPNDDIVEVALEGLDHLIPKPRELYAEEGPGGLTALEIVDADDVKQIVKLRDQDRIPEGLGDPVQLVGVLGAREVDGHQGPRAGSPAVESSRFVREPGPLREPGRS